MSTIEFAKDPQAILDYVFDWSAYLESSETITSRIVTVDDGITKDSDTEASGLVTVWLSGGTAGTTYQVACRITTNAGRTDERTISIKVRQR